MLSVRMCEYAAVYPDGTFTAIRAGIDQWDGALPAELTLWVLVQVDPGVLPQGCHVLRLQLSGPGGTAWATELDLGIGSEVEGVVCAVPLEARLRLAGSYVLDASCGVERGRALLLVGAG